MKDTGLKDLKGNTIYEESIIGLRMLYSKDYYDKVTPRYNDKRQSYEFVSSHDSLFHAGEKDYYYSIRELYGCGSTFEVIA